MSNNIRNTNLRFNLDKDLQRKAWQYLQTMDKQVFKSYSHVITLALVDFFDRQYLILDDPYLETREREEHFVEQIVLSVENALKRAIPTFFTGYTDNLQKNDFPVCTPFPPEDEVQTDIDWDFLGE